jgi:RNA polymerase sigma-70 factor (ECF subfamily)
MLHDHDDTDEVLQETLIRLFRYIGSLKEAERFAGWVMRIAVNQVQTFRVRRRKTRLYEIEEGQEIPEAQLVLTGKPPADPRQELSRQQVRREIREAMEALPDRQRAATTLFEIEGMSIRQIADALGCSEGAVKFNIHEGRKKLQRRLVHLVRGLRWGRGLEAEWERAEVGGVGRD